MIDTSEIRRKATAARAAALARLGAAGTAVTPDTILGAALMLAELHVIRSKPGSHLLKKARAKLDPYRGVVIIDRTLPDDARRFSTAHELGHFLLEGIPDGEARLCETGDVEEAPITERFPIGEAYITGYSPRQRNEVHASLFAAEFLAPIAELCNEFAAGQAASELAAAHGVSITVVHGQLTAGLLHLPPAAPGTDRQETATAFALHAKQHEARRALPGPVSVDAGPGTGKTRTLTERVTYLVRECGVSPEQILGLTFSNKAAEEMSSRIARALGRSVRVQTFHAFGLDVLRDYPTQAGIRNDVTLLDPVEVQELLDANLTELGLQEYHHITEPGFYFSSDLGRDLARQRRDGEPGAICRTRGGGPGPGRRR